MAADDQPSPLRTAGRVWSAGAIAILIILTVGAYWPAFQAGFIWDDDSYVTANPLLQDLDGLGRIWIPRQTPQYYPAVFTTFWIEHQLWGLHPAGYHIVNAAIHVANALLLWRLCLTLRIPHRRTAFGAWMIAATFALHPVHVESVAWVTERKNVLSGLFYLTAALCYLRFDSGENQGAAPKASDEGWGWYGLSLGFFILALLSKTVTCSLPAALILVMLHQRKRITAGRLATLTPMFIVGLILALNTAVIEREHVGATGEDFDLTVVDRFIIAGKALWFYVMKLVWPVPVMFIYPRWEFDHTVIDALPLVGVVIVGTTAVIAYRKGWRGPGLALAFYAGTVFPALGFVNIYPMRFSFVADHFQYLASIVIIILAICALALALERWTALTCTILAMMLPSLAVLTFKHARTFESAESVWSDTLRKNPDSWMPHNNLGNILIHRDPSAAERHYREALRLKPGHYPAQSNLGEALRIQGRLDESVEATRQAIELIRRMQRDDPPPWPRFAASEFHRLGLLLESMGGPEQAIGAFRQAAEIEPRDTESRRFLAKLLIAGERWDEAEGTLQELVALDPADWASFRTLALLAQKRGDWSASRRDFESALRVTPSWSEQLQVLHPYIQLLVECPDPAQRDPERALWLAEQSADRLGRDDPLVLQMLASVHARMGRFADAAELLQQAILIAERRSQPELVKGLQKDLENCQAAKAPPGSPVALPTRP